MRWTNKTAPVPTVVSKLSTKTGLIYTYIAPKHAAGTPQPWYWAAIDARTGKEAWRKLAGTGLGVQQQLLRRLDRQGRHRLPRDVRRHPVAARRKRPMSATTTKAGRAAARPAPAGPSERLMRAQAPFWNLVMDHYFRMEMEGWDRLPAEPSLLIGVHSGGSLTMDAWTVALQWHRRFGAERTLHPHRARRADGGAGPRRLLPRDRHDHAERARR